MNQELARDTPLFPFEGAEYGVSKIKVRFHLLEINLLHSEIDRPEDLYPSPLQENALHSRAPEKVVFYIRVIPQARSKYRYKVTIINPPPPFHR